MINKSQTLQSSFSTCWDQPKMVILIGLEQSGLGVHLHRSQGLASRKNLGFGNLLLF